MLFLDSLSICNKTSIELSRQRDPQSAHYHCSVRPRQRRCLYRQKRRDQLSVHSDQLRHWQHSDLFRLCRQDSKPHPDPQFRPDCQCPGSHHQRYPPRLLDSPYLRNLPCRHLPHQWSLPRPSNLL